jgi:hypothetical protein
MANVKITDLTAYTDPLNTDVLAIVDVTNNVTKKVSIANMAKNVSLGTAALPGVAFDGDPNTGIYSPGADQLAVATNGQGRLFIDASGNLGLGVTPVSQNGKVFHIDGGAGAADIRLTNNTTGSSINNGGILALSGSGIYLWNLENDILSFGTNNAEKLRITSGGLVGIGDSAPESLLHLKGSNATLKIESSVNTGYSSVEFDRAADDTHFAIYAYDSSHASQANNVQFYGYQNGNIQFITNSNATPRLTITSAGLVGIGTTTPQEKLEVNGNIANTIGCGGTFTLYDAVVNRNNRIQLGADASGAYINATYSLGGTGALRFQTVGAERGRFDESGRLLVGTSSARGGFDNNSGVSSNLQVEGAGTAAGGTRTALSIVNNGSADADSAGLYLARSGGTAVGSFTAVTADDALGRITFSGADGTEFVTGASIEAAVDGTPGANDLPSRLVFSTTADGASSPTERMRIKQNGVINFGNDNLTGLSSSSVIEVYNSGAFNAYAAKVSDNNYYNFAGQNSTGTTTFYALGSGDVRNTNNSYGAISDAKLKENIVDADSQWADLKALQVRKYNFKKGQTHTQIGLVAQEVELVSPGLVADSPDRDEDGNDLGTVTKSVNYSVLYMKAVKALQEAMERIETLETRLTAAGIA